MINDRILLEHAIRIAKEGIEKGSGPFGAVIAIDGEVVSEAVNRVVVSSDPTAHAEILAIRRASEILKTHNLSDCALYTSCEPCPMCLGAIYWAGIKKVVYASDRFDAAASGFSDSSIYEELKANPSLRSVKFIRYSDTGGEDVFRKWDEYEDKIPY